MLFKEAIAAAIRQKKLNGVIKDDSGKNFFEYHTRFPIRAFAELELEAVTTDMLEVYRHDRATATSNATANRDFQILRFTFNLAVSKGWIKKSPLDAMGVRELPEDEHNLQFLTVEERSKLAEGAEAAVKSAHKLRPWTAPIDKIEAIASNTGMQKSEVLRLEEAWVVPDLRLLKLPKIKRRPPREIPMNEAVFEIVMGFYSNPERKSKFLITNSRTGKPYSNIRHILRRSVEASGLKRRVTLHQLRHTFATAALTADVSEAVIAELLGHVPGSAATKRYAKVISKKKVDAVDRVGSLFNGQPTPAPVPDVDEISKRPARNLIYFEELKEPKKLQG